MSDLKAFPHVCKQCGDNFMGSKLQQFCCTDCSQEYQIENGATKAYLPTPEEIAAACAELRKAWVKSPLSEGGGGHFDRSPGIKVIDTSHLNSHLRSTIKEGW